MFVCVCVRAIRLNLLSFWVNAVAKICITTTRYNINIVNRSKIRQLDSIIHSFLPTYVRKMCYVSYCRVRSDEKGAKTTFTENNYRNTNINIQYSKVN